MAEFSPHTKAIGQERALDLTNSSQGKAPAQPASTSVRMVLWILLVVYIFNFLDRQIVNTLAEPIRKDLALSDTQVGLLTGLAFAMFYAILGLPIARYADRQSTNRVGLISIALVTWSGMTAVCGIAQNYFQLLLARVGVGVGEAGCSPAAHSLISDIVPAKERPSAMAFYALGIPIGSLLGHVIGGPVADVFGWRMTFLIVGLPGILLAVVISMLVRDPRRTGDVSLVNQAIKTAPAVDLRSAFFEIVRYRPLMILVAAASFSSFLSYGKATWVGIFFMRSHGLSLTEVGLWLGLAGGISGMVGTWLGGWFAVKYGSTNRRHVLTSAVIGMAIAAPAAFATYFAPDWKLAMLLVMIPGALNALYVGPTFSCVQGLVRPELRAVASAFLIFCQNLIGLGFGPLFFGMLSDFASPFAGQESVRWVLYGAAWLGFIPAFLFWRASLHLNKSLDTPK